jgi:hypothetical protein
MAWASSRQNSTTASVTSPAGNTRRSSNVAVTSKAAYQNSVCTW